MTLPNRANYSPHATGTATATAAHNNDPVQAIHPTPPPSSSSSSAEATTDAVQQQQQAYFGSMPPMFDNSNPYSNPMLSASHHPHSHPHHPQHVGFGYHHEAAMFNPMVAQGYHTQGMMLPGPTMPPNSAGTNAAVYSYNAQQSFIPPSSPALSAAAGSTQTAAAGQQGSRKRSSSSSGTRRRSSSTAASRRRTAGGGGSSASRRSRKGSVPESAAALPFTIDEIRTIGSREWQQMTDTFSEHIVQKRQRLQAVRVGRKRAFDEISQEAISSSSSSSSVDDQYAPMDEPFVASKRAAKGKERMPESTAAAGSSSVLRTPSILDQCSALMHVYVDIKPFVINMMDPSSTFWMENLKRRKLIDSTAEAPSSPPLTRSNGRNRRQKPKPVSPTDEKPESFIDTLEVETLFDRIIGDARFMAQHSLALSNSGDLKMSHQFDKYIAKNHEALVQQMIKSRSLRNNADATTEGPLGNDEHSTDMVDIKAMKQFVSEHGATAIMSRLITGLIENLRLRTEGVTYGRSRPRDLSLIDCLYSDDVLQRQQQRKRQEEQSGDSQSRVKNVSIMDMTPEEALSTFFTEESFDESTQSDKETFLEQFSALQQLFREELLLLERSRDEMKAQYKKILDEHQAIRAVTRYERERYEEKVDNKFDDLARRLRQKFTSRAFTLQNALLSRTKKRGNLPRHATNILRSFLFSHFLNPYPTEDEKHSLSLQTGLTITQINNWFINARVRIWRPMLDSLEKSVAKGNDNTANGSSKKKGAGRKSESKNEDHDDMGIAANHLSQMQQQQQQQTIQNQVGHHPSESMVYGLSHQQLQTMWNSFDPSHTDETQQLPQSQPSPHSKGSLPNWINSNAHLSKNSNSK